MITNEEQRCLEEYQTSTELRSEFLRWGFPVRKAGPKGQSIEELNLWIETVKKYPGFLLNVTYTAAKLGVTEETFGEIKDRKEILNCVCSWASGESQYYYAALIENFYRSLLEENKVYDSLITSNKRVAKQLKVTPALCNVCKQPAVNTICDNCKGTVDPGHTEPLNSSLRPIMFQLPQICWKCIFTDPPQTYPLILGEERMEQALIQVLEEKWLTEKEIDSGWVEKIRAYQT